MPCDPIRSGFNPLDKRHSSSFCMFVQADISAMNLAVPEDASSNLCKLSSTTFKLLPRIGVYPGTFRTFIDLRDEHGDGFESSEFSGSANVLPGTPTDPAAISASSKGGGLEINGKGNAGRQLPLQTAKTRLYDDNFEPPILSSCMDFYDSSNAAVPTLSEENQSVNFEAALNPGQESLRALVAVSPDAISPISQSPSPIEINHLSQRDDESLASSLENSSTSAKEPKTLNSTDSCLEKQAASKLSIKERKRIIVPSTRPLKLTKSMQLWISKTHDLLDPFRDDDDCWFHPSPPACRVTIHGSLRPCGKIQKAFTWQDLNGKHSIVLNYGIVSKLINYKLTKQQKDGFINKQWHLSHLCGNWTCLNPTHTTVEPGMVNISRNVCFSHRAWCVHDPPCLKEKKVPLGADGKVLDPNTPTDLDPRLGIEKHDDWAPVFDDGDDCVTVDGDMASTLGF